MKANYEEDKASLKEQLLEMRDSLQAANVKVTEMEEILKSSEVEKDQLEERLKIAEVKIEELEQQGDKEDIGQLGGDKDEANSNKYKLYQAPIEFSTFLPYHLKDQSSDVGTASKKKQGAAGKDR